MYNLLKYIKNYRNTTGSVRNYYRDEPNDFPANNYNANPITNSESFKYKSSITGKTSNLNQQYGKTLSKEIKIVEIVAPLKHLSNFGEL